MHLETNPKKLTPDVNIPVRSPRTGVRTVSGVWKLGVEEVVVLEISALLFNPSVVYTPGSDEHGPRF